MENRLLIAYALCAVMVLIITMITVRYLNNRKQFKIRQSGRGKGSSDGDSLPAE